MSQKQTKPKLKNEWLFDQSILVYRSVERSILHSFPYKDNMENWHSQRMKIFTDTLLKL